MSLDPEIIESLLPGRTLFNEGKFFEAHEIWEEKWRDSEGDERHLLQGLIQVAAGVYKLQTGMPTGTVKLLQKGAGHLRAVPPDMYGVQLSELLEAVDTWITYSQTMVNEFRTNYDKALLPALEIKDLLH